MKKKSTLPHVQLDFIGYALKSFNELIRVRGYKGMPVKYRYNLEFGNKGYQYLRGWLASLENAEKLANIAQQAKTAMPDVK
jgi:hypothetical protein